MKILHVMLGSSYIDNMSYQENLLPKFHKKLGYDVEIIASQLILDSNGSSMVYNGPECYVNENNIHVLRLPFSKKFYSKKIRKYDGIEDALYKSKPDIIFIHNLQFIDVRIIAKYCKKNKNVKLYVDNHADYANSATNWISKNILHKVLWKHCAKIITPYVEKFYGVLPARVDFLSEMYGIPKSKIDLLVMGADDEIIELVNRKENISKTKKDNGILDEDFLIVTGGKINRYRPETLHLMKSIINSRKKNIKLLVFGNPSDDLKEEFEDLCKNDNIIYVGWVNSLETYQYMASADLVIFPGLHSVMWEQAVALGKPCVFRDIKGFHHVDVGGNCIFLKDVSVQGISDCIESLLKDTQKIKEMEIIAKEKGFLKFAYSKIAEQSIK